MFRINFSLDCLTIVAVRLVVVFSGASGDTGQANSSPHCAICNYVNEIATAWVGNVLKFDKPEWGVFDFVTALRRPPPRSALPVMHIVSK